MRRSLLQNSKRGSILLLSVLLLSCGGEVATEEVTTEDTAAVPIADSVPPAPPAPVDTPQSPTAAAAPVPTKGGTEIRHQSEDDKLLDSIKKAKAKDKTPVNREIKHGSDNDALLDSIKKAKSKGKY